ncbi:uncharacterized protein NPIL_678951 [Nephila pilipes]|uniref:Uncharacterized protein n=1 Tax=Nephila pilipes TaxID=299642 RepID=A0A8X6Q748_NEPPI|nr:uncharacterized protein NPIL_678951 [Nephila pilipes]
MWWHGPKWLTMKETELPISLEPTVETEMNIVKLELKKLIAVNATVKNSLTGNDLLTRCSIFSKLIGISAFCLRFIFNCKMKPELRKTDCISASEFVQATGVLVKQMQLTEFPTETKFLKDWKSIPKNSKTSSLNVFLNKKNEILRVGRRLKHSAVPEFQKHQIVLPNIQQFPELIINYYHNYYRDRKLLNKRITCFRTKNQTNQMMRDSPRDGIVPTRPFESVGKNCASPIITKPNLKSLIMTIKSYIVIFINFRTKAVILKLFLI